jgi:anti-sigma factor RsiW
MPDATCKESIDLLLEYLDGELPGDLRARLEAHLGGCAPCEEFLRSYRATPTLCRRALAAEIPEEVAHRLTEFLRAEFRKTS